ncbi:hypothetical protein L3Q82_019073 [Scortum barcoo]|uniref:Uncharacterized protein n=1 Tax=Scortum barcoo TaxID=214431 RepID=A0ACB8VGD1_9TELE|nr:hypothetical protein L3Q82_019073 [Scortum barcoo]
MQLTSEGAPCIMDEVEKGGSEEEKMPGTAPFWLTLTSASLFQQQQRASDLIDRQRNLASQALGEKGWESVDGEMRGENELTERRADGQDERQTGRGDEHRERKRSGGVVRQRCYVDDKVSKVAWLNRSNIIFAGQDKWSLDPRVDLVTKGQLEYSLRIQKVDVYDEGSYTCSIQTKQQPKTSQVYLIVQVPPNIYKVSEDITVNEGSNVTLSCLASGRPDPAITWRLLNPSEEYQGPLRRPDWRYRGRGAHPGARPGVGARRRAPGGRVFAHGTRPGSARNGGATWARLPVGSPPSRKVHEGPVQCGLGSSRGREPRRPNPWNKTLAIGTWNVTSLGGKEEPELCAWEVERYRLEIVGLTSTHSLGSGTQLLERGWTLHYSGVAQGERRRAGVGLLIAPQLSRHVLEFTPVNERVASLRLRVGDRSLAIVCAYGPNSSTEYPPPSWSPWEGYLIVLRLRGLHCSTGGLQRSLTGLSITNTMFEHKGVHQCTWHQDTLGRRSMIDFVVVSSDLRPYVLDTGHSGGITLLSLPGKVYARVLERRIRPIVDPQDSGGTMRFSSWSWNSGPALYTLRIGCARGFMGVCPTSPHVLCGSGEGIRPCPSWYSVGGAPCEYGVRGPLLRAVRSLYDRSRSLVRIAGSKSDLFPVHVGLRQGCPLSPVLFIIFMDRISRRSQPGPEGVRFGNHRISSLLFADDVVLLASSSQDLQHVLERFAAECVKRLG